jgi:hypothetical protein
MLAVILVEWWKWEEKRDNEELGSLLPLSFMLHTLV